MNCPSVLRQSMPHGLRRALGEDLELLRRRVVAPDGGVHARVRAVELGRRLHVGVREDAVQAVEPAVRAPLEGVQRLVRVLAAEALQQHLELARLVVLVLDEPQVRRRRRRRRRRGRPRCRCPGRTRRAGLLPLLGTGKSLPSAKTVRLSHAPSPSVSSRMTMRSRGVLPFGVRFGYSKHSTTQTRPFSSMVNAIGLTTCGSPAKSFTSNSSATLNFATVSSGLRYGWPDALRLSKPNSFWANARTTRRRARRRMRGRFAWGILRRGVAGGWAVECDVTAGGGGSNARGCALTRGYGGRRSRLRIDLKTRATRRGLPVPPGSGT